MNRLARGVALALIAVASVLVAANLAMLALIGLVLVATIVGTVRLTDWLLSKLQKG
jgi:hypothetical protein